MRRIERRPLSPRSQQALAARTWDDVRFAASPHQAAERLWRSRTLALQEAQRLLSEEMAPGRGRCMYCEDSAGTAIDHFWPKQRYPMRAFEWENMLWACSGCNSNLKREQFPLDAFGAPLLLDPTEDEPMDHLDYLPASGELVGSTPRGEASAEIFKLNDMSAARRLPKGRRDAWRALERLLTGYAADCAAGRRHAVEIARREAQDHPFASLLRWMLRYAAAGVLLSPALRDVLEQHPEIASWV